jgi:hypothetical protein
MASEGDAAAAAALGAEIDDAVDGRLERILKGLKTWTPDERSK